jgi:hypothetical protein
MALIFNTDKTDSCLNSYREVFSDPLKSGDDNAFNSGVILPLDFSLEMDGLSGIIPHSAFVIPSDSLPSSYIIQTGIDVNKQKIAFILHTIEQNFSDNKWTTRITGQTLNIRFEPLTEKEKEDIKAAKDKQKSLAKYKDVGTEGPKKTAYPELPFTTPPPPSNVLTFKDATKYLNTKYGKTLGESVFAVLFAEARHDVDSFKSAGGYNYGGVQTDAGRWGTPGIIGQYSRVDSGGVTRSFAIFKDNESFLDFMANRISKKGILATTPDIWVTNYINKWWSPAAKSSYTKGTPTYNSKLAIYNSAAKRYNNLV